MRSLGVLCVCVATLACRDAAADSAPEHWVVIARDPNYDVAIDSVRIRPDLYWSRDKVYRLYQVWYRTDHKTRRLRDGKPFDREVVHSMVMCDSLWYKVMSVDMSLGAARPIAQQRTERAEIEDEPWRRVALGTTEEIAARAACVYGARRRRAGQTH